MKILPGPSSTPVSPAAQPTEAALQYPTARQLTRLAGSLLVVLYAAAAHAADVPGGLAREIAAAPAADVPGQVNPLPPVPVMPRDGETLFTPFPSLEVEPVAPFCQYHFRVTEGSSVVTEGFCPFPVWSVAAGSRALQAGHSYEWSCRAYTSGGWSEWFAPHRRFVVDFPLRPPRPKLPEDGSVLRSRWVCFVVDRAQTGATYQFQVWDGRTLVAQGTGDLPWWRLDGGSGVLEPGRMYEWTCRLLSGGDSSGWFGPRWRFQYAADQRGDGAAAGERAASGPGSVAVPNPFRSSTIFICRGCQVGEEIVVHGGDGRLVRHLAGGSRVWDGRDEQGVPVGPGVYICRIGRHRDAAVLMLVKTGD